jgi:hypothetical protein
MRKFITPILASAFFAGMLILNACGGDPCEADDAPDCGENGTCIENAEGVAECECDSGYQGEFCEEKIPPAYTTGNLEIIVKKLFNGKVQNNFGCLAVLGRSAEEMYWLDYDYGKLPIFDKQKRYLSSYSSNVNDKIVVDTAYSRKGGTDPADGGKAGIIKFEGLQTGTYYLHVFDGSADKWVGQVTVTADSTDDLLYAEVQPLGNLKVTVAQSSIAGTELDSNIFMLWGPSTDTFIQVMVKDYDAIPFDPYYEGRTGRQEDENGNVQSGLYFLMDIPTNKYLVVAYNNQFANKDGQQASGYVKIRKNILDKVRVSFKE